MRKFLILLMIGVLPLSAQNLFQDFDYVTVTGTVVMPGGDPVVDCNVEIRIVRQGGSSVSVLTSGSRDTTRMKKAGWARTDENGMYKIDGVPVPGSYVVVVKGVEGYRQTQMPIRIDEGTGDTYDAGKLVLEKFREIDPKAKKLLKKASKSLEAGELDEAEALLKEADSISPDLPEVYVSLGNIYLKKKDYQNAYANFKKAFDMGERKPQLSKIAAQMAFQFQKFDDALEFLGVVLEADPEDLNATYLAGVSAYNLKNFELAQQYFQTYLDGKGGVSRDVNFLYVFGMTELALDNLEAATKYLHEAYRFGWKADVGFMKTLANAYIKLDNPEEAKAVLKELLDKYPEFEGREQAEKVYESL